ncbi:hypothetical protein BGX34_003155 [Mortierella sp. NVP85]|nr:hypothetical protein BGX34_003155 [Mortierella sp. NVP85]
MSSHRLPAFFTANEPEYWCDYKDFIKKTSRRYPDYQDGSMFHDLFISHLKHITTDEEEKATRRDAAEALLKTTKLKGDVQETTLDGSTIELDKCHEMIYNFAIEISSVPQALAITVTQYDIFVALSGILNATNYTADEPHPYIDPVTLVKVRELCQIPDFSKPMRLPLLEETLEPLRLAFSSGDISRLRTKAQETGNDLPVIQSVTRDLISYLCQFPLKPPLECCEFDSVSTWHHVLRIVSRDKLSFNPGELGSSATKDQSLFLESNLNADTSVPAYGRKLDMQLRFRPDTIKKDSILELNNSEFKKHDTNDTDLALQLKKNILVNQAMLFRLNTQIGLPLDDNVRLLALDVRGWLGRIICLRKMDDLWACDFVCDDTILLPHNKATWDDFLKGHSIAMLWNYVQHLTIYLEMVVKQELHNNKSTFGRHNQASGKPLSLGQFTFLPTKSRLKSPQ